jgi:tetratricopeptide (TPR) repeat protein
LPLALEIVAGRAIVHPDFPLQVIAEELQEASARLDRLGFGDPPGNVRAVFSWSYAALPPQSARVFRLIGIAPGATIEASAIAALTGTSGEQVRAALMHLESSSLIYQYRPYRYRLHDLVRLYAAEQAAQDEDAASHRDALRRILDHYLFTAYSGDRLIAEHRRSIDLGRPAPGSGPTPLHDDISALQWFSVEHSNLLAAQNMAAAQGWFDRVWQFAWVLDSYHWRRGHLHEDITSWEAGLAAAEQTHDTFAIGLAHRRLGRAYGRANRYDLALEHMTTGLGYAERAADAPGQAHARRILSWICHQLNDDETALRHAIISFDIYTDLGNPVWTAHALDELGVCYLRLGQYAAAMDCCRQALELHRSYHHRAGEAESLDSLGNIMLATGQYLSAAERYREALAVYRALDNTYDEASVLEHLGHAFAVLGRQDEALRFWEEALSLYKLTHRVAEAAQVAQLIEEHRRLHYIKLERILEMDQASFDAAVSAMEGNPNLRMKSLIATTPDVIFNSKFNRTETPTDVRSISKLAVSMTLGIAMQSGTRLRGEPLSLDMKIAPFFPEFISLQESDSRRNFADVRLWHLLSNTIGHRNGFLFRKDIQDQDLDSLLNYIFAQQIEFKPGTHFSYSNVGWYLVSVIIKNELGISLSQWVSEKLFSHLGIDNFTWVKYGEYEAAATGLALEGSDVHKLGELLLADGVYRSTQVVPRTWIETIRSPIVKASSGYDPSSPLQATAYGYGIWICDDGTYYCDGSGGQFLIVAPGKRLIISALAEEGDTLTVSCNLRGIIQG